MNDIHIFILSALIESTKKDVGTTNVPHSFMVTQEGFEPPTL